MIGYANANLWNLTTFRLYEVLSVQIIAIQSNFFAVLGQIITFGDYNVISKIILFKSLFHNWFKVNTSLLKLRGMEV